MQVFAEAIKIGCIVFIAVIVAGGIIEKIKSRKKKGGFR